MRWSIVLLVLLWDNVNVSIANQECSTLPTFENAFVSEEYKKAEYRKGDVIYFSCKPGYSTRLNTTYICTEQGWRAVTIGQCFDVTEHTDPVPRGCTPPPPLENGFLSERSNYFYVNGVRVRCQCNNNYTMSGQPYMTCSNGQWTRDIQCKRECSMKKGVISYQERKKNACKSTLTSKVDYVYRVTVMGHDGDSNDYAMRIERVIKEGNYDRNAVDRLRKFIASSQCRTSLNLQIGKSYLIMGTDPLLNPSTMSFEYSLGGNTWIEYWPRAEQCQTEEYRHTCLDMDYLVVMLEMFGCPDN